MSRLVLCTSCERHVRSEEQTCPFCLAPVAKTVAKTKERPLARGPVLTRAALLVAGAATGLGAGGCADEPEPEDADRNQESLKDEAAESDARERMAQPAYGVPIDDSDLVQPAYGVPVDPDPDPELPPCSAPPDAGLLQPAYGVPIDPPDAGLLQPAYGVPIDRVEIPPTPPKRPDGGTLPQPAYGVPVDTE